MMWYLQFFVEWVGVVLAQTAVQNGVFACLALWAGFGRHPRVCAVLTALVHMLLMMI